VTPTQALRSCYDEELKDYLQADGYTLHWTTDENHLELFECGGGYFTNKPFWEHLSAPI
jgi:hypothetical protein